ncbi:MAG: ABC transporter substrate-binding protein, partial [Betaproteobacteria bacterium]|nr:ABC transporter substrate-binding protein [Betaproteobacteria bacterium]
MKNSKLALSLLAVVIALAGCSKEAPKPAADKGGATPAAQAGGTEVKIGHVAPLTGGIAHLGKDNENGARLAIEEANAAGIKIDGKDVKFTLVAEDDQADPKVGTTVAQ